MKVKWLLLIAGMSLTGLLAASLEDRTGISIFRYICVLGLMISVVLGSRGLLQRQQQMPKPGGTVNSSYELMFRYMPCAAKVLSPEFDLLMINNETTQLTGIQEQGALGKKCYDVFGEGKVCPDCPVPKTLTTKRICTVSNQMRCFNATKFYMNQTAIPLLNQAGAVEFILEMSVDITEREMLDKLNHCMFMETVSSLAQLINSRDHSTGTHSERVREIAIMIGKQLQLAEAQLQELSVAAILHDIGKIGIPEHILHKAGKLSVEEFSIIQRHAQIGYDALKNISPLRKIAEYIRFHHEAVDGSGYPRQLSGDNIPLISKILCVADVYEALTADRVYRPTMTQEQAVTIMREGVGKKFDPNILQAFFECMEQGLIASDEFT